MVESSHFPLPRFCIAIRCVDALKGQWEVFLQQKYDLPRDFEQVKRNLILYSNKYVTLYSVFLVVSFLIGLVLGHALFVTALSVLAVFTHIAFCSDQVVEEPPQENTSPVVVEEQPKEHPVEDSAEEIGKQQEAAVVESLGSKDNFDKLKVWSHQPSAQIIFDSETQDLTSHALNTVLNNQTNVVVLIKTKKDFLFGSFTSLVPQLPTEIEKKFVVEDKNTFIFSIRNQYNIQPFKTSKNKTEKTLKLYNDDSKKIIGYNKFFTINKDGLKIKEKYAKEFDDTTGKGGAVFVGVVDESVEIDNVKVIRFFNRKTA